MEDSPPIFMHWTKYAKSIDFKKYQLKDLLEISCGLTQKTFKAGRKTIEELAGYLDQKLLINSTIIMD